MAVETVRVTQVRAGDRNMDVSTIRLGRGRYDTVIFDRSPDRRHHGKWLDGNKIGATSLRSTSRESAMDTHRAAIELIKDLDNEIK